MRAQDSQKALEELKEKVATTNAELEAKSQQRASIQVTQLPFEPKR